MSRRNIMPNGRIKWAARLTTLAAIIILIIVLAFITRPTWGLLPLYFFVIFTAIAWLLPEFGGPIIVIGSIAALIRISPMTYDIEYRIALVAPWVIFLGGGVLHLIAAWRAYRIKKRTPG